MEYIILLVSVASLSANIYLARKVSNWFKVEKLSVHFEPVWESKIMDCCTSKEVLDPVIEDQLLQIPSKPPTEDESQYAWKNATGLPAAGPQSISPSMPPPIPGPLERPYGFPG